MVHCLWDVDYTVIAFSLSGYLKLSGLSAIAIRSLEFGSSTVGKVSKVRTVHAVAWIVSPRGADELPWLDKHWLGSDDNRISQCLHDFPIVRAREPPVSRDKQVMLPCLAQASSVGPRPPHEHRQHRCRPDSGCRSLAEAW